MAAPEPLSIGDCVTLREGGFRSAVLTQPGDVGVVKSVGEEDGVPTALVAGASGDIYLYWQEDLKKVSSPQPAAAASQFSSPPGPPQLTSPPDPAAAPPVPTLRVGTEVEIHSLVQAVGYNGLRGVLVKELQGGFLIDFRDGSEYKLLMPENLRPIPPATGPGAPQSGMACGAGSHPPEPTMDWTVTRRWPPEPTPPAAASSRRADSGNPPGPAPGASGTLPLSAHGMPPPPPPETELSSRDTGLVRSGFEAFSQRTDQPPGFQAVSRRTQREEGSRSPPRSSSDEVFRDRAKLLRYDAERDAWERVAHGTLVLWGGARPAAALQNGSDAVFRMSLTGVSRAVSHRQDATAVVWTGRPAGEVEKVTVAVHFSSDAAALRFRAAFADARRSAPTASTRGAGQSRRQ
eukprot:TRINITY_DN9012_c0_g1_i1.p1 TRINITY_DN9012_c0_g1~~TRINITY_DN9012_c0_g1_i1.p1  ORF type:complete len:439 (+),score=74.36 TRINITY_DN9012_c0_g1_i1:105-1319(+)